MISSIERRSILQEYLVDGRVDYEKLQDDDWVQEVYQELQKKNPEEMSRDDQLAFWLNAYNIITLKAVMDKLEDTPTWKGVTSIWRKFKFFVWHRYRVGGRKVSLYSLENKILREEFDDPRIHFAINCASKSCPYLPGKLFDGADLDDHLEKVTRSFINDQGGVRLEGSTLLLSKIFEMYTEDFGGEKEMIEFIRKYFSDEIPGDVETEYMKYDWSLNKQEKV